MEKNRPILIEAVGNGFVVSPVERGSPCAFGSSSVYVFNQLDDVVKWLREHFAPKAKQHIATALMTPESEMRPMSLLEAAKGVIKYGPGAVVIGDFVIKRRQ